MPLVVAAVALTTVVAGQTLMRARLQPWGFLALAVLATVGAQLAGLLAARTEPTAETYLTAYAVVVVLAAVVALVLGRPLPPTVERERVRAGIRLATPLLPQAAAMLGLLSGDVLLARVLVGEAGAGSYQVALQLGNMPFVLAVALFNAWGPLVLSHPIERRWAWTARTGTALTTVVAAGAAGVALLGPWLVAVMADPASTTSRWSARSASSAPSRCRTCSTRAPRWPCSTPSAPAASRGRRSWPSPCSSSSPCGSPHGPARRAGSSAWPSRRPSATSCSWR